MKKFLEVSALFIALISVAAACGGDSHPDDPGDTCPSTLPECSESGGAPCRDPESGLVWSEKAEKMTWEDAKSHCTDLNSSNYCGFSSGWHLPMISELRTLLQECPATQMPPAEGVDACAVRSDEGNVCLSSACWSESTCYSCSYDPESSHSKFGDIEWFWSSSLISDNLGMAWLVGFDFGFVGNSTIEEMGFHYVRCVR